MKNYKCLSTNVALLLALTLTSSCFHDNLSIPKPTKIEVINQDFSAISEVKDDFIETKPRI